MDRNHDVITFIINFYFSKGLSELISVKIVFEIHGGKVFMFLAEI